MSFFFRISRPKRTTYNRKLIPSIMFREACGPEQKASYDARVNKPKLILQTIDPAKVKFFASILMTKFKNARMGVSHYCLQTIVFAQNQVGIITCSLIYTLMLKKKNLLYFNLLNSIYQFAYSDTNIGHLICVILETYVCL